MREKTGQLQRRRSGARDRAAVRSGPEVCRTPSQEEIARRAWEIHIRRERPLGQWRAEWRADCLRAERELRESAAAAGPDRSAPDPDMLRGGVRLTRLRQP